MDRYENLARLVVDSWDMDTLIQFAVDNLTEQYKSNFELFLTDLKDMQGAS